MVKVSGQLLKRLLFSKDPLNQESPHPHARDPLPDVGRELVDGVELRRHRRERIIGLGKHPDLHLGDLDPEGEGIADAAVVGSGLVSVIENTAEESLVEVKVAEYIRWLKSGQLAG